MADDEDIEQERGDPDLAVRIVEAIDVYSGKTQRAIAGELDVAPQSITKWRRWGYLDKIRIPAFCRACGVSIEWFLTGEGDPKAKDPLLSATSSQITAAAKRLSPAEQLELAQDLVGAASKGLRATE